MIIMIDPPAFHAKVLSESNNTSRDSKMSETFRDLPPTFVHSMKKLFDYFDVDQSGRIPIATISSRWNPDKARAENLPPDLIRHLEKVTDRRGFLTFERFCAGLKIAILRHQPSSPEKSSKEGSFSTDSSLNRTSSLPNLLNDEQDSSSGSSCGVNSSIESPAQPYIPPPPPKPPRYIYRSASRDSVLVLSTPSPSSPCTPTIQNDENVPYVDISTVPTSAKSLRVMPPSYRLSHRFRRQNSRTRRHSVHALLESDVMAMVKKWEQERSLLEEGLRILDRVGRDYQDRLSKINHRIQNPYKGETGYFDVEDKDINYQKRVHNLNGAMSRLNSPVTEDENSNEELHRQIERLKDQNKMLTEEVSRKCCVISSMEREKSAIIKELFQSRSLISQFSKKAASGAIASTSIAEDSIMTFI